MLLIVTIECKEKTHTIDNVVSITPSMTQELRVEDRYGSVTVFNRDSVIRVTLVPSNK